MFANNPVYRWQNHGEFNMVFNSDHQLERRAAAGGGGRPRRELTP
jgi:hypothetical protein